MQLRSRPNRHLKSQPLARLSPPGTATSPGRDAPAGRLIPQDGFRWWAPSPTALSLPLRGGCPLHSQVWGVSLQNAHPRARRLPSTVPATQDGHLGRLHACLSPGRCCKTHRGHHHVPGKVLLAPAQPLGFGVHIPPPIFRSRARREQVQPPPAKKPQATSLPTCFIFHCASDPGAPNSFLPLNYFTRSIYL